MQDATLKPVMIVPLDGFADWETALIAGIGAGFHGLPTCHATPDGGSLRLIGGLTVTGLTGAAPRDDKNVVLCDGDAWTHPDAPDPAAMPRATHACGNTCVGTLAPARAGLLDDRAHTSNGPDILRHWLADYTAAAQYRDQPQAVSDGGIITAPISLAAAMPRAAGPQDKRDEFPSLASAEVRH